MKLGVAGSMWDESALTETETQVGVSVPLVSHTAHYTPPAYVVDYHNRPPPYRNDSGVWSTTPLRPTYVATGEQV